MQMICENGALQVSKFAKEHKSTCRETTHLMEMLGDLAKWVK